MGCDIHFFVEVFDGKKWKLADGQVAPCERCKGTGLDPEYTICANCQREVEEHELSTKKCLYEPTLLKEEPKRCDFFCYLGYSFQREYYSGRNYELFGILSGVRGDSDPDFTIEDRGVPDDCDPFVAEYMECEDYHSRGFYTLAELQSRDWPDFEYFQKALARMDQLADDPEHVRAVFCYDN